jgi:hypothetical protein
MRRAFDQDDEEMAMRKSLLILAAGMLLALGCEEKPSAPLAPPASALAPAAPPAAGAVAFKIDSASSRVSFVMDAELEKIFGRAPGGLEGELFIDLKDVAKSTGRVKVDLDKLSIYQQVRKQADEEFAGETKNEKQNQDMRNWFEIESDAPAAVREKNRWAQFRIDAVNDTSAKDVTTLPGPERKLTLAVSGEFLLHQRATNRSAKLAIEFKYAGDKPQSIHVKTLEPVEVGLQEHDVRPRKAFSVLADKTLDALGAKVAKVAKVSLEFDAVAK